MNVLPVDTLPVNTLPLPVDTLPVDTLPIEIINKIINYTGVVTFFRGKYYNKIPSNDARYTMLINIIKPPTMLCDNIKIINLKKDVGESYNTPRIKLTHTTYKNNVGDTTREELRVTKLGRKEYYMNTYVLSKQNIWCKIVEPPLYEPLQ